MTVRNELLDFGIGALVLDGGVSDTRFPNAALNVSGGVGRHSSLRAMFPRLKNYLLLQTSLSDLEYLKCHELY